MNFIVAGIGLALGTWSLPRLWAGWSARAWPTTTGEVVTSSVQERRNKSGKYYVPHVRYTYEVEGRVFFATRRTFRIVSPGHSRIRWDADMELKGLGPGARLTVYHHPWLPRLAVLRPGVDSYDFVPAALGAIFVGAAFVV